jgi:hypothetical protein
LLADTLDKPVQGGSSGGRNSSRLG